MSKSDNEPDQKKSLKNGTASLGQDRRRQKQSESNQPGNMTEEVTVNLLVESFNYLFFT